MKVGTIEALFRYPVKSMRGESLEEAELGWHGIVGDRRLALRRMDDRRGFPWLTASTLPDLVRYAPVRLGSDAAGHLPTHVRPPGGVALPLFSPELADEVSRQHGEKVEMTHLDRGIFDEASISAITSDSVEAIAALTGHRPDVRRFRPNLVMASHPAGPFLEDAWVGGVLVFGEGPAAAAMAVTNWDERCAMLNIDPDTGLPTPEVLKAVVRERNNKAGIYATVIRRGRLAVGQSVYFTPGR